MFAETKSFLNKFYIDVSSLLMSSLRAIVSCQKYCGNRVISSQIHLFAPLLNMRRCTLCISEEIRHGPFDIQGGGGGGLGFFRKKIPCSDFC